MPGSVNDILPEPISEEILMAGDEVCDHLFYVEK